MRVRERCFAGQLCLQCRLAAPLTIAIVTPDNRGTDDGHHCNSPCNGPSRTEQAADHLLDRTKQTDDHSLDRASQEADTPAKKPSRHWFLAWSGGGLRYWFLAWSGRGNRGVGGRGNRGVGGRGNRRAGFFSALRQRDYSGRRNGNDLSFLR
jgi:hypothetical protein